MKKSYLMTLIASLGILTACQSVPPQWSAVGGSRADGIVRLAYEQSEFSSASPSLEQGKQVAASRCKAWGYHSAEAFGGSTRQCIQRGGLSGCALWQINAEYQCTTEPAKANTTRTHNMNINRDNEITLSPIQ